MSLSILFLCLGVFPLSFYLPKFLAYLQTRNYNSKIHSKSTRIDCAKNIFAMSFFFRFSLVFHDFGTPPPSHSRTRPDVRIPLKRKCWVFLKISKHKNMMLRVIQEHHRLICKNIFSMFSDFFSTFFMILDPGSPPRIGRVPSSFSPNLEASPDRSSSISAPRRSCGHYRSISKPQHT